MREPLQAPLLRRIEAFLQRTAMAPSTLSRQAVGDSTVVSRIRKGTASLTTCNRVAAWLDREEARRRNIRRSKGTT
jgi:hypothetical protein